MPSGCLAHGTASQQKSGGLADGTQTKQARPALAARCTEFCCYFCFPGRRGLCLFWWSRSAGLGPSRKKTPFQPARAAQQLKPKTRRRAADCGEREPQILVKKTAVQPERLNCGIQGGSEVPRPRAVQSDPRIASFRTRSATVRLRCSLFHH